MQKILYYIQAAFLVEKGKPCFNEPISRWRHGPVVVDVYNQFSKFIGERIDEKQEYYKDFKLNDELEIELVRKKFEPNSIKKEDRDLINEVVNSLINLGPWDLVERTHEEDPWINTQPNEEITTRVIKNYFMKNLNGERIYGRN